MELLVGLDEAQCAVVREMLSRIGGKWSLHVLEVLSTGPKRFGDLRRRVEGVSQRMLSLTLRFLERDGLVARTVYGTVSPGVEYELTPLGRTMMEPLRALVEWALVHCDELRGARLQFEARTKGGGSSAGLP